MKRLTLIQDTEIKEIENVFYSPLKNDITSSLSCLVGSLESIDVLNKIVEITSSESISLDTFKLYSLCVNTSLAKLGLDNRLKISTEDNSIGLSQNVYLSNESISEAIENSMKAISALFIKTTETIEDLWKQYASATSSLKKRIDNTRKTLNKINKNDVTATFKDTSLAKALKKDNQVIIKLQIDNTFKIVNTFHGLFDNLTKVCETIEQGLERYEDSKQTIEKVAQLNSQAAKGIKNVQVKDKDDKDQKPVATNIEDNDILVGNKAIQIYVNTEGNSGTLEVKAVDVSSENVNPELNVLPLSDINSYLSSLEKLTEVIDNFKSMSSKTSDKLKDLLNDTQKNITQQKNNVKKVTESLSLSHEVQAKLENENTPKDDDKSSGDKIEKKIEKSGKLENKETKKDGSVDKSYLTVIKSLIKTQGNASYIPQKTIIEGSYKIMSYIDKSLVFYK
jgi:hypothetical protein